MKIVRQMNNWAAWLEVTAPLTRNEDGVELRLVGSTVIGVVTWVVATPLRNASWAFLEGLVYNG